MNYDSSLVEITVTVALYREFVSRSDQVSQKVTKGSYLQASLLEVLKEVTMGRRSCTCHVSKPGRYQRAW